MNGLTNERNDATEERRQGIYADQSGSTTEVSINIIDSRYGKVINKTDISTDQDSKSTVVPDLLVSTKVVLRRIELGN